MEFPTKYPVLRKKDRARGWVVAIQASFFGEKAYLCEFLGKEKVYSLSEIMWDKTRKPM